MTSEKKRNIHLLCNAHLDPVWMWQWKEGASEALSTFRTAADLCEEFDTFIQQLGAWPNPPDIDWETEMVLAFTWGEVMSSGFWIEMVDACWDDSDVLHVDVSRWWPGPNCPVAWVICSPFYVVKCERWEGDVIFEPEYVEDPCKEW